MAVNSFKEIKVWQRAHSLALFIYKITENFPKSEIFGLMSQMRRAAVSVPSNLAEGFKRKSKNDSLHFYNIAQGSLEELRYQLLLSKDLGFVKENDYKDIEQISDEVGKMLYSWIKNYPS